MTPDRSEVEAALAELRNRITRREWDGWAELFTEDARYADHHRGTFQGRQAIAEWACSARAGSPALTFAVEWSVIEGNRAVLYVWHLLPDPAGRARAFAFPVVTVLEYAGGGRWSSGEDFYNPVEEERVLAEWRAAGGGPHTEPNHALRGLTGVSPSPSNVRHTREEVEDEFSTFVRRGRTAVATGDWAAWSEQFTPDARYADHHVGTFVGRDAIRDWMTNETQPLPVEVPIEWHVIEGNRVVMVYQNRLPDPSGAGRLFQFPTLVILHYEGDGKWAYEEDVYNPEEAPPVVNAWLSAGGSLPQGAST